MATIATLIVDVLANTSSIDREVRHVNKQLDGLAGVASRLGGILAGAFTVGAVVGFVKEIGRFADEMQDLSEMTGISTESLQALNYVATGAGTTIEQVADALSQMGKRLTSGQDGVNNALKELNLNASALRRLAPDEAFMAIARAIARVQNPMDQSRLAMELFGKSGAKLLPLLKSDIAALTDEARRNGAVISESLINRAAQLDNTWKQLMIRGKALLAEVLIPLTALPSVLTAKTAPGAFTSAKVGGAGDLPEHVKRAAKLAAELAEQQKKMHDQLLANAPTLTAAALANVVATEQEIAALEKKSTAIVATIKAQEKADEAQKRWLETTRAMNHGLQFLVTSFGTSLPAAIERTAVSIEGRLVTAWQMASETLEGLMTAAPATQFMHSENLSKLPSLIDRITGSLKSMWEGMSGGKGVSGIFSNLGKGLIEGFGQRLAGALSKGISGAVDLAAGLAIKGLGKIFTATKGWVFGPIGAGLSALFGQAEHKKVNDMRDAFIAASGGLHALNVKAVEAGTSLTGLLAAKKVADFHAAVTGLNATMSGFAAEQAADQERLQNAIEKYGFTIEELGPKLQQQRLHEQATELIEDWRVLVGAGIDIDTVSTKMADSINAYLQLALKTGAEVPLAMKPILEHMANLGVLTDASGAKVTDLGQLNITWSETMTQGFDRVVSKLEELIQRLQSTGSAIASIPRSVDVTVTERHRRIMEDVEGTQRDDEERSRGFAHGTHGRFIDFGAGSRVTLHGRERVMTEREGRTEGKTSDALMGELRNLRRDLPRAMKLALREAIVLSGGMA